MLEIRDNMFSKMPRRLSLWKNSAYVNPVEQRGLTEGYLWSSHERLSSLFEGSGKHFKEEKPAFRQNSIADFEVSSQNINCVGAITGAKTVAKAL